MNFVPMHILDYKVYYEAYLENMRLQNITGKAKTSKAISDVSGKYDISRRQMERIVKFMAS